MTSNKALPVPKKQCPMCQRKALGEKWTQYILSGERTSVDAIKVFHMTIDEIDTHVYKHAPKQQPSTVIETHTETVEVLAKPTLDKDYFLTQLDDINCQLQEALEIVVENGELDTRKLTSLTKEIRETLKLLAEVAGVIGADNSAAMQANLLEMQQKYLTLTGLILEVCCPVCQRKIEIDLTWVLSMSRRPKPTNAGVLYNFEMSRTQTLAELERLENKHGSQNKNRQKGIFQ